MRYDSVIDRLLLARGKYEDHVRSILQDVELSDRKTADLILSDVAPKARKKYKTRKVKTVGKRKKLHWTQKPENRAKVHAMSKRAAKTRKAMAQKGVD